MILIKIDIFTLISINHLGFLTEKRQASAEVRSEIFIYYLDEINASEEVPFVRHRRVI
jgi:hypothetical protein